MLKIGVLQFERIEGPLDEIDAARESIVALPQLEPAADAGIAISGRTPSMWLCR